MDNSNTPTAKVGQIPIVGAAVLIITYVCSLAGVDIPAEVAIAIVTVVSFGIGYFLKDRRTPDRDTDATAEQLNGPDHRA